MQARSRFGEVDPWEHVRKHSQIKFNFDDLKSQSEYPDHMVSNRFLNEGSPGLNEPSNEYSMEYDDKNFHSVTMDMHSKSVSPLNDKGKVNKVALKKKVNEKSAMISHNLIF